MGQVCCGRAAYDRASTSHSTPPSSSPHPGHSAPIASALNAIRLSSSIPAASLHVRRFRRAPRAPAEVSRRPVPRVQLERLFHISRCRRRRWRYSELRLLSIPIRRRRWKGVDLAMSFADTEKCSWRWSHSSARQIACCPTGWTGGKRDAVPARARPQGRARMADFRRQCRQGSDDSVLTPYYALEVETMYATARAVHLAQRKIASHGVTATFLVQDSYDRTTSGVKSTLSWPFVRMTYPSSASLPSSSAVALAHTSLPACSANAPRGTYTLAKAADNALGGGQGLFHPYISASSAASTTAQSAATTTTRTGSGGGHAGQMVQATPSSDSSTQRCARAKMTRTEARRRRVVRWGRLGAERGNGEHKRERGWIDSERQQTGGTSNASVPEPRAAGGGGEVRLGPGSVEGLRLHVHLRDDHDSFHCFLLSCPQRWRSDNDDDEQAFRLRDARSAYALAEREGGVSFDGMDLWVKRGNVRGRRQPAEVGGVEGKQGLEELREEGRGFRPPPSITRICLSAFRSPICRRPGPATCPWCASGIALAGETTLEAAQLEELKVSTARMGRA
ncbi:hypothetical protein C8R45DRAFT_923920 [Mycena sanguinolenta]|nr:hypothetical protein C8R45DRAFT_923920 [Mycena sanguinolenta]